MTYITLRSTSPQLRPPVGIPELPRLQLHIQDRHLATSLHPNMLTVTTSPTLPLITTDQGSAS